MKGIKAAVSKLLGITDSPRKISWGFGLGLFLGVFPGTGPTASLVLSWLFRVNKAAALAGSLLINTWINVVAFPLALGFGAWVTRLPVDWLKDLWARASSDFHWGLLVDPAILRGLWAMVAGFVLLGLLLGLLGALVVRLILHLIPKKTTPPVEAPPLS